jgi:hypothetical protein
VFNICLVQQNAIQVQITLVLQMPRDNQSSVDKVWSTFYLVIHLCNLSESVTFYLKKIRCGLFIFIECYHMQNVFGFVISSFIAKGEKHIHENLVVLFICLVCRLRECWDPINRFNPDTCLSMSQARTWGAFLLGESGTWFWITWLFSCTSTVQAKWINYIPRYV